jgi:hypothetical protein
MRGLKILAALLLFVGCSSGGVAPDVSDSEPADMALPPADVEQPPADVALPPADVALPPADVALPPADVVQSPADPLDLTFGSFSKWATPIEDYIAINTEELGHSNFMKEIFDLAVFDDRLHFGYGDANLNLGRITPIEVRYFTDPTSTAYAFDFVTDEEQIDRFRFAEELLMIPGVDATEDAFLGNAYTLPSGGEWFKSRTLQGGWHVHDIAAVGDALYACGSGGTGEDYSNSTVHAFLWHSLDGGESFEVLADMPHPNPPGDHRLVHLLPLGQQLYAFGYFTDDSGSAYGTSYRLEGEALTAWDGLTAFFVTDTVPLTSKAGLLVGVHIEQPLRQGVMRVTGAGAASPVDALAGHTLLDAQPLPDGRAVLLYLDGDAYPLEDKGGWKTHVGVTTDGSDLVEIASAFPVIRPVSVAFWRDSLFIGMANGAIWKAKGE